jgi:hemolysin activation/secretion protein
MFSYIQYFITLISIGLTSLLYAGEIYAQTLPVSLPSAADPSRIDINPQIIPDTSTQQRPLVPSQSSAFIPAPEGTQSITLVLENIVLTGNTAFSSEDLVDIYEPYIGRSITLDIVWLIAGQITERYRSEGYFLSIATVPAQDIDGGIVQIHVTEGHISQLKWDNSLLEDRRIQEITNRIMGLKPLKAQDLERALLNIRDFPGVNISTTLAPIDNTNDGSVQLIITDEDTNDRKATLQYNNQGSRFNGPSQ